MSGMRLLYTVRATGGRYCIVSLFLAFNVSSFLRSPELLPIGHISDVGNVSVLGFNATRIFSEMFIIQHPLLF